jgi:hypothetical protein
MPVAFDGLIITLLLLVGGFVYLPRYVRRRWPDDWATPLMPLLVLWVVGCGLLFFAYEWAMGRA